MFAQLGKSVITVIGPLCIGISLIAICLGVSILESSQGSFRTAYTLIGLGSMALLALPRAWSLFMVASSRRLGAGICAVLTILFLVWLIPDAPMRQAQAQNATLLKWGAALVSMVAGGIIWDSGDSRDSRRVIFDRIDWMVAVGFFALALFFRLMVPPGAAVDEGIHFSEMQDRLRTLTLPPLWGFAGVGMYPQLLHHLMFRLTGFFTQVVDPFVLHKIVSSSLAAVSVGGVYLLMRVFVARHIAITAGAILVLMGWHWLNSRFLYIYPHDLANVALGSICAIVAFETKRVAPALIAGIFVAYTWMLQKIGLMLAPFIFCVFVDYLLSAPRESRKRVGVVALIILVAALLAHTPVFVGTTDEEINRAVATVLPTTSGGPVASLLQEVSKVTTMTIDALSQIQVQMHDTPRHIWRLGKPILDPISSVLFSVGVVFALTRLFRRRDCRLALGGLFTFILPMALSYPLDSEGPHGLSRRMVGASFFVAWLAAYGAEVVATRLVSVRYVGRVCVSLGAVVMFTNLYELYADHRTLTKSLWHSDQGGARAAMIEVSRGFARNGYAVVVLNEHNTTINGTNFDLPNLQIALDLDQLRKMVLDQRSKWQVVIIPSGNGTASGASTVQTLSDIIPASEWIFGPVDFLGVPMLRYALLRPGS